VVNFVVKVKISCEGGQCKVTWKMFISAKVKVVLAFRILITKLKNTSLLGKFSTNFAVLLRPLGSVGYVNTTVGMKHDSGDNISDITPLWKE
jgi:hypothetical protein